MPDDVVEFLDRWLHWVRPLFFSCFHQKKDLENSTSTIAGLRKEYVGLVNKYSMKKEILDKMNWPNFDSWAYLPQQIMNFGSLR